MIATVLFKVLIGSYQSMCMSLVASLVLALIEGLLKLPGKIEEQNLNVKGLDEIDEEEMKLIRKEIQAGKEQKYGSSHASDKTYCLFK